MIVLHRHRRAAGGRLWGLRVLGNRGESEDGRSQQSDHGDGERQGSWLQEASSSQVEIRSLVDGILGKKDATAFETPGAGDRRGAG